MNRFRQLFHSRGAKRGVIAVVLLTGSLLVALVAVAVAKSFVLQIAKTAKVTNQSGSTARENIVVTPRGHAVYTLSGDSKRHPKCTKSNQCFSFWPPVTVSSSKKMSKPAGIKGKLGVWRRNGLRQLTLAGHPLYRFATDTSRDHATGEGIKTFGGTWHVIETKGSATRSMPAPPTTTTTTTTSSTTTSTSTPCVYCY
jgi:predicted lipoprotein with Yx(FWY)xxD motif